MKKIYKCEFCDKISNSKEDILEHEKICGYNPKNEISDEIVIKLSRIYNHLGESLIYIITQYFSNKIDLYLKEFDRATTTNCPASVWENKDLLRSILVKSKRLKNGLDDWKYFSKITERDNPELIEAIKIYLKEPEYRIK